MDRVSRCTSEDARAYILLRRRGGFRRGWSSLAWAFLWLRLHFGLRVCHGLRFGLGLAVGDRGLGSGDCGLRYAAGAAVGEDDAFQFSGLALGVHHDEVEAGAVEQRDQGFAEGQRGDAGDDLFLGGAGRNGDIGAGQAVDLVENLGQADVIGDDA